MNRTADHIRTALCLFIAGVILYGLYWYANN